MGMEAMVVEVTSSEVSVLRECPEEIQGLLGIEPEQPGLIGRLFGRKPAPMPSYSVEWGPLESRSQVDLDKNWDVLHTLLTGDGADAGGGSPAGFIWHGGSEVGDLDLGHGPARLFNTDEARDVLGVIQGIDERWFSRKWDHDLLKRANPYPSVWADIDDEEAQLWREDLAIVVDELRDFLSAVVERDRSFVLWVW